MKYLILIVFVLLNSLNLSAQKIYILNTEENRLLVWDDFKGIPSSEPYDAHTYWNVSFDMKNGAFKHDTLVCDIIVNLKFDSKLSWCKKEKASDYLLKHEQGHFNIGKLFAGELNHRYKNTVLFKSNYNATIKSIFYELRSKYTAMEKQYDDETNHSKNKEGQQKWDDFFVVELKKYKL